MNDTGRYREFALECVEAARRTDDERNRVIMIAMAQAWTRLAQQADRNSRNDLVYETPPPKKTDRHIQ